ncbi:E3 ubiquitin-protein ligase TRIM35-like [Cololabis saira]|uniref:E3 ubiquitin-protein ligase TRIM35-like n=1 Tax=Cololabis saira TaxID=129043 RepID=UPI002AD43AB2|nr:E3 ubiquitin-protein ligase TRIM35-like [Cololabis saira]
MASSSGEDLWCPVCHDIFRDPVILSCSHSFCRACIQSWWAEKETRPCPCCKRKSSRTDPPRNLALKNLCEAFPRDEERRAAAGSEHMCSLHGEKLKIFCLDHQEPVCVVCRDSRTHSNHRFRPINEAAQDLRQGLQRGLTPLREKLTLFQQVRRDCIHTADYLPVQARDTENKIRQQFQKLHQFLEEEEKARMEALREEEEQKSRAVQEKMEALTRDVDALSDTIRATETELRAGDVSLLLNHKVLIRRVKQGPVLKDPELVSGALIDVAKHLGNLTFNLWKKMSHMVRYSPVILDPNTADPELVVSDDLLSVTFGGSRELPNNPERTRFPGTVLGSEGVKSGIHVWKVDVGCNADWEVGMLEADGGDPAKQRRWRISLKDGRYKALAGSGSGQDLQGVTPQKITVYLDFDEGMLIIGDEGIQHNSDSDSEEVFKIFTHKFTGALFPYVYTQSSDPLEIMSFEVSVTTPSWLDEDE